MTNPQTQEQQDGTSSQVTLRLQLEGRIDELQQTQAKLAREMRKLAEEEMAIKLRLYTLVD